MGLISEVLSVIFGSNRNVLRETVEVFRENLEAGAGRGHDREMAALAQMQAEFQVAQRGRFDRLMDAVNRMPRPALALGTLGLMVSAMADPVWFAERMQGLALVPEPLWWLLGVVVSFYFGARQQVKSQQLQRDMVQILARAPQVVKNISALRGLAEGPMDNAATQGVATDEISVATPTENPALDHWTKTRRGGAA
ncbi:MAG: carboxylesterase [Rhodobacteraceae bacterium]|nr:carboxylesterase [Paracoccaceae bacterium]